MSGDEVAEKTCASCGRRIEWRASMARDWDSVRYCSAACRRRKVTAVDRRLEEELVRLLRTSRSVDVTEAARALAHEGAGTEAELREPARRAARRLVAAGEVEIVQRGRVVDPSTARGPIDVRRPH